MSIQVTFSVPDTKPGFGAAAESDTMLRNHCLSGMELIASKVITTGFLKW